MPKKKEDKREYWNMSPRELMKDFHFPQGFCIKYNEEEEEEEREEVD